MWYINEQGSLIAIIAQHIIQICYFFNHIYFLKKNVNII